VIVILPITVQPGIIIRCLEAGKHVLSEKPVAPSVEEGKKLISTHEATFKPRNLIWRVAENYEAEPGYWAASAAIKEGKIGEVVTFNLAAINNTDKDSKWYKTPWRTVPDYQGGFLLDGGVHSAVALRVILPSPLKVLTGFASLTRDYLAPQDTSTSIIKCESGAYGTFDLTFASPAATLKKKKDGLVITGTKGWLECGFVANNQGDRVLRTIVHHASGKPDIPDTEEIIDHPEIGVTSEIESFLKAILGEDDGKDLGSPRGALQDVAVIQAALNSNGNAVDLQALLT
jgi:predicted dehydrogenase